MARTASARSATCSVSVRSASARSKTAHWKNCAPPRSAWAGKPVCYSAKERRCQSAKPQRPGFVRKPGLFMRQLLQRYFTALFRGAIKCFEDTNDVEALFDRHGAWQPITHRQREPENLFFIG